MFKRSREEDDTEEEEDDDEELQKAAYKILKKLRRSSKQPINNNNNTQTNTTPELEDRRIKKTIAAIAGEIIKDAIITSTPKLPEVIHYCFYVQYPNSLSLEIMEQLNTIPGIVKTHIEEHEVNVFKVCLVYTLDAKVKLQYDQQDTQESSEMAELAELNTSRPTADSKGINLAIWNQIERNIKLFDPDPSIKIIVPRPLDNGITLCSFNYLVKCPVRYEQARRASNGSIKNIRFTPSQTLNKVRITVDFFAETDKQNNKKTINNNINNNIKKNV